jgi:fructose-1,6-bisphosphatase II / sedoheptulose-1,7-bisphosphatase
MLNGVEINGNKYSTETLVTHKSLKFKEIIKRTNLIEK